MSGGAIWCQGRQVRQESLTCNLRSQGKMDTHTTKLHKYIQIFTYFDWIP
jgi:hypothetical protein